MKKFTKKDIETLTFLQSRGYNYIARLRLTETQRVWCATTAKHKLLQADDYKISPMDIIVLSRLGISPNTLDGFMGNYYNITEAIVTNEILSKSILDNTERRYLEGMLKPYINQGMDIYITKMPVKTSKVNKEHLFFQFYPKNSTKISEICSFVLPPFKKDTMYCGMALNTTYHYNDLMKF